MDNGQNISKLQSLFLNQISTSSEFEQNVLQNCLVEISFDK